MTGDRITEGGQAAFRIPEDSQKRGVSVRKTEVSLFFFRSAA